jgi:hypothetical protein
MARANSVQEYLAALPPATRKICKELRALALENMPGAIETMHHNAMGFGTSESSFDRICYIAAQPKGYVNFGFFFGLLPDPTQLLTGEGKRIRHVKIYSIEEAKNPALKKLVKQAWKNAEKDIGEWRQSLKRR